MSFLAGDHSDVSQVSPPVSFTIKPRPFPTAAPGFPELLAEFKPEGPGNSAICNQLVRSTGSLGAPRLETGF